MLARSKEAILALDSKHGIYRAQGWMYGETLYRRITHLPVPAHEMPW